MKNFFLLVAIFLNFHTLAQPPDLVFKHITVEQGLSQPNVYNVIQDYKGFIWICTQSGLNKYDGYKISVYKNSPEDSTSIGSNDLRYIYEDREKNLWIGTSDGLDLYDRANDCFTHYRFFSPSDNKFGDFTNAIYEDRDSNIWVGTAHGAVKYNKKNKSFKNYSHNPNDNRSISNNKVCSFGEDKQGNLWMGTADKLNQFDKKTNTFKRFSLAQGKNIDSSNDISSILFSQDGRLYMGTKGGFFIMETGTNTITRYAHDPNNIHSIGNDVILALFQDRRNNLWIGTENGGLNLFHPTDGSFTRYVKDIFDPHSIINNTVDCIYEDSTGTLWVGCQNGGLNFCNPYQTRFRQYKQEVNKNSISNNVIRALVEDHQKNIWIATDGGGVSIWNRKENNFSYYKNDINNSNSVSSDYVLSLFEDSDRNIWMGTYKGGLNKLDRKTNIFSHYVSNPEDSTSLSSNTIWDIVEDEDKNLWVCTREGGVCMLDKKTNKFVRYLHHDKDPRSLDNDWTMCLLKDSKNNIWVGTFGALDLFDKKSKNFTRFTHHDNRQNSNEVHNIFEDKKGNIWTATPHGLNLLDRKTGSFIIFMLKDGESTDMILSISDDSKGNLWVSTLNEISSFNIDTKKFKSYSSKNEFLQNVDLKTKEGEIIFGGSLGFSIFNPDSIRDNPFIPPVFFTDFQIFNKPLPLGKNSPLTKNINEVKEITLSHEASVFSFEFAALSYEASEKNRYAYQLEGFDKEWNYIDFRRNVTYTNLDPGIYNLKVKASNNDGVWNEKGFSIKIVILPPWWKTWWFRTLSVIFIALIIFIFYFIRLRSIKLRNIFLEQEVKNRTADLLEVKNNLEHLNRTKDKFFSIIGHDLKGPVKALIALIGMLKEGTEKMDDSLKILINHIDMSSKKVHDLILSLLEWAKTQTDKAKVESVVIPVPELLHESKALLSTQAQHKQIEIVIDSHEEHRIFGDYNMVTTIVRNILSNSIKYTHPGGLISLTSSVMHEGYIKLAVEDNGIGMSEEVIDKLFALDKGASLKGTANETGTGLGMIISHEFAELNKGKIYAESTIGKGSIFYIILPTPALVDAEV